MDENTINLEYLKNAFLKYLIFVANNIPDAKKM